MRKFKNITYPDKLLLEEVGDGDNFLLLGDFRVFWTEDDEEHNYMVPAGFETDLASIPKRLTSLIPKLGLHNKPSVVHDHMYVEKTWAKTDVDLFFRRSLRARGVTWHRRVLMWLAVRSPIGRYVWDT